MRRSHAPRGFFREGGVGTGESLRRQAETILERAAGAGYPDPARLLSFTPKEIEWALRAQAAGERRRLESLDAAAWLTGRYTALAILDPRRYPKRPDGLAPAPMQDGEMKAVFERMAQSSLA